MKQRLDLALVFPDERDRLAAVHHLAILVMFGGSIDHPIGRHIEAVDVGVKLVQRSLKIMPVGRPALDTHPVPRFPAGSPRGGTRGTNSPIGSASDRGFH